MPRQPDFDVGIIGGGPAGSSLAAYLARAGAKVVVFERERFPRPHVGESLVPSSTRVFADLGFLPVMEQARFPHKYGAVWTSFRGGEGSNAIGDGPGFDLVADVRFDERHQPGVEQSYTYHVDRGKFDSLLLQHAAGFGAEVVQGVGIQDVDFGGTFPRLEYSLGRKVTRVSCRIVADASGRKTFLGNRLKMKVIDKVFEQYAIHTWFEHYDRLATMKKGEERKADYIYVHFTPITNTWLWQIPITDTITSIGVVTQRKHFKAAPDRRQFFWDCVATRPELCEALEQADQLRDFSVEGDYSYAMTQITGDGWLMVGDAGRFVDPIFSTGVSIALNSARFAHRDILKSLESGNHEKEAFAEFEATLRRGTRNWYNLIAVYYRLNVLFTAIVSDPLYRLELVKLLQGDVYEEQEPEVLVRMRNIVGAVESDPRHIWHKLLSDLTNDAFRPAS
jgi:FADH2 O2-dependent halogenase